MIIGVERLQSKRTSYKVKWKDYAETIIGVGMFTWCLVGIIMLMY